MSPTEWKKEQLFSFSYPQRQSFSRHSEREGYSDGVGERGMLEKNGGVCVGFGSTAREGLDVMHSHTLGNGA